MDLNSYLAARNLVISIGRPILFLSASLALVLLLFSFYGPLRKYSRHLIMSIVLLLATGYAILVWFHYQIYLSVPLINPVDGQIAGRYAIPVWIEDEKLLFWTLLIGMWLVFIRPKKASFQIALNAVFSIFIALTVFTSDPFSAPLNNFNGELNGFVQAINSTDFNSRMQVFGAAIGRMQGFYNSTYMWIHPPLLFVAYSAFVVSFLGIIYMLATGIHEYERFAYNWAKSGYIVLTLGLLLGYPWAFEAWKGQPWWYSPKINVTLMMWVLYTAYLHSRIYLHRKGMWTTTGMMGILSFVGVVATYLSTYVLPGIHSVG